MTYEEKNELIRVVGENYDEFDVPAFIRRRDEESELRQIDLEEKIANEIEEREDDWVEMHGARQDENGEWQV